MVHRFGKETIEAIWCNGIRKAVGRVDLVIDYNCGKEKLIIHLEQMMRFKSVQKFKKMLKTNELCNDVRQMEDNVSKIKKYVQEYLEQVEPIMKEYANKYESYKGQLPDAQEKLDRLVEKRSILKKNSQTYKELTSKVNDAREQVRHIKSMCSSSLSRFNEEIRMKKFLIKCLVILESR